MPDQLLLTLVRTADALHRHRGDRGQTASEYLGIVVLVGAIIAAIVGTDVDTMLAKALKSQISSIVGTKA